MGNKLASQTKWIKNILFLSILIFIAFFFWKTDFNAVFFELKKIGPWFLLLLFTTFIAYLIGTWSWHICLGKEAKKINIWKLFAIRQVGETVGQYNPGSILTGDLFKVALLKPYGIDNRIAVNSVASSRLTVVLSQIMLFFIACLWLLSNKNGQLAIAKIGWPFYAIFIALFLLKISLFFWIANNKSPKPQTIDAAKANFWKRLTNKIKLLLFDMRKFYQQDPKLFWKSYFLAALHWIVGSLEFYLILRFLGFAIQPMHGLLLDMSVIVFKSMGAFIPGQLGVEELGNKMMLGIIGIRSASVWITVSILRRARQICWIAIGFILYLFIKKNNPNVATS